MTHLDDDAIADWMHDHPTEVGRAVLEVYYFTSLPRKMRDAITEAARSWIDAEIDDRAAERGYDRLL